MCLTTPLNKSDNSDEDGVHIADESDYFLEEDYLSFHGRDNFQSNSNREHETKSHEPRSKRNTDDILKSYMDNLKAVLFQLFLFIWLSLAFMMIFYKRIKR